MSLTREQLLALDKETLVENLLQQNAPIAELESTLAALAQRIAELEARLNQNSRNSSKPPSTDPPVGKTALRIYVKSVAV